MPIMPLPQFEADLAEQDRALYESLKPPTSLVVKFGIMKLIGEFPYSGDAKPGCGSKVVCRTHRGTEMCEMLTSTCPNAGCSKSISRKEMLEYIDRSGGKDYPFFNQGKVLRIATVEDLNAQARLEETRPGLIQQAREAAMYVRFPAKIVDAEPILGGERLTFYFTSEDRIDFRALVDELAKTLHTRIEMRQVGARDEARLVADYEKCGQHCCCKQFLKVLKPVSMKNAKIQKATLDPLKISGRCGRLMCCLRYEEQSYDELRARLPKRKTRVDTEHGAGLVLDTQILTQLVLVQLEDKDERVAVPLEELTMLAPGEAPKRKAAAAAEAPPPPPSTDFPPAARPPERQGAPSGGGGGSGGRPPQGPRDQRGPRPDGRGAGPGGQGGQPPRGQGFPQQRGQRPGGPGGQGQGGAGGPPRDQRQGPSGDRPPRAPEPRPPQIAREGDQRAAQGGPAQPPTARPPQPPRDELDDIMQSLDAQDGDHHDDHDGPQDSGPGGPSGQQDRGGPEGGGGRRRRRRRRRGGGGGGGGPQGGGGGGGSGGPPPGGPASQ